jgi:hypothetical protein
MKRKFILAISAIVILTASSFVANDCTGFDYFTTGTQYTTTSYDAKGTVLSAIDGTVKTIVVAEGTTTATIDVISKNGKGEQTGTSSYDFVCDGTSFRMDLKALAAQQANAAGGSDAEISIEADKLEYPTVMVAGQSLPSGTLTMTMKTKGSPMAAVTTMNIKDRKCEAIENKTTAAGTYLCYKITSTIEGTTKMASMSFPVPPQKTVEWFSFKVGSVRSETYKDGALQGYQELTKFTKGQ